MALIEPFMIKSQYGVGTDSALELEAKTGESLLVKDVIIRASTDDYVLLEIDKTTVGFFRVDNHVLKSHLSDTVALTSGAADERGFIAGGSITLLSYLIKKGWMRGYPVAEGQTFRVKPYTSGKRLNHIMIIYEKYDAGDIKATDPNGSESKEYVFVNYGRVANTITTSGDHEVSNCITTKEFPDFPFGKTVPSKTTIDILGVLGSECIAYVDDSNYVYTTYVKMFKGRTCLFDMDKKGIPFLGIKYSGIVTGTYFGKGYSYIGNYTNKDRREPFVPPRPLTFSEGDELKIYVSTEAVGSSASLNAEYPEIALIERVKIGE